MAAVNPPPWMQAGSYPARTDRLGGITAHLYYAGFSADEATPLRPRAGVRPSYQGYQLKVRAATTPNMTVIVSAGIAWVDNHDVSGYGTYCMINDADVTLTIAPAGGAGQYRKDSVGITVYDAETAGSVSECRLEVVQGPYAASAGSTVRGTIPPNMVVLADISVAPSQTSIAAGNIGDVRNYTVSLGGIAPISSTVAPNRPHPGQVWYEPDQDRFRYGKSDGSIAILDAKATAWTPLTLAGAWVPLGGTGDATPSARITADGCLELSGTATGTAVGAGLNAVIGTVPAALVSLMTYWTRGVCSTSVASNYARIAVAPSTGSITLTNGSSALTSGGWVQLDGIRGRAS